MSYRACVIVVQYIGRLELFTCGRKGFFSSPHQY